MRAIERKGLPRQERILASLFRVTFYTRIAGYSTCTGVRIADGWPTQACFWLEWGSSTAGQSLPAARSRFRAEGAPSLRVLCARVGTTPLAQWALPLTPRVPQMNVRKMEDLTSGRVKRSLTMPAVQRAISQEA